MKIKGRKISNIILIVIYLLCIAVNVISWQSSSFSDWYAANLFPVFGEFFGRITSLADFSVGEIMIGAGILFIPVSIIVFIISLVLNRRQKQKCKKACRIFGLSYAWIAAFILTTETFGAFSLYHCSSFAEKNGISQNEHTNQQLINLADMLIEQTNNAAKNTARNDKGEFVLSADPNEAIEVMQGLGEIYPQFSGYYPKPKAVKASYFMSQQYLMGVYFPFSAEVNYNRLMYPMNIPETICHELAHSKGIILEDEANFVSYLACINSDKADFVYSAYIHAMRFALSKVRENCGDDTYHLLYSKISPEVYVDLLGNYNYWQSVQNDETAILDSKKVAEISDKATNASLKLNGVEDGTKSYGRMIDLLLNYYEKELIEWNT